MKKFFLAICVLQFCLIFILVINLIFGYFHYIPQNTYSTIQTAVVIFLMPIMLYQLKRYLSEQVRSQAQSKTIDNIQEFNLRLRSQRHDFINHIQIVYGLIEMDEFSEAKKYLQKVYGEMEVVNKFSRTADVAFNALLQAKHSSAERRSIQMHFEITTNLQGLPLSSLDICRVISNIIDNCIFAAERYSGEKKLNIEIKEAVNQFEFIITNTGDTISPENLSKIFRAGFTTKGNQGEGMGLYITRSIVEKYGGIISVTSENDLTRTVVLIPKSIPQKRVYDI